MSTVTRIFLITAAVEAGFSPRIGALSDRRGRLFPIRIGLALSAPLAVLLAAPSSTVMLGALTVVVVLAMSLLWTPAMALLSDRSEATGLDLAFAAALVNLAWAGGQVVGGSAAPRLAQSTTDATAYAGIAILFALSAIGLIVRRGSYASSTSTGSGRSAEAEAVTR
jgi:MFS family permease